MVFSPEHESRVRSLITTAVQTHIDTPGVIVPIDPVKPNPIDPVKPNPGIKNKNTYEIVQDWTNYQTSRYMIQIIWNTTGSLTSNFPTTVQ